MTKPELQQQDVENFIFDFELYCGTIREITDVHGPHGGLVSTFGGVVHTWMDSFNFTVMGIFCTEEEWGLRLSDPVESLRKGHRHEVLMKIPKLHKNFALAEKYHVANSLYKAYNSYSNLTEASRIPHWEEFLGYQDLPSYMSVVNAIVTDYRSYGEKKKEAQKELCRSN